MGVAAKYLARKHSKIVGFVGACAQSRTQLMSLIEVCKELEEVRVWSRSPATRSTSRETADTNKLWRDNKSRLIQIGMALIVLPEPTPVTPTIDASS